MKALQSDLEAKEVICSLLRIQSKQVWASFTAGNPLAQRSPNPKPWDSSGPKPDRKRATEQDVSSGPDSEVPHGLYYCQNHSPAPPWKNFFQKTGPWCQKGWGPLL